MGKMRIRITTLIILFIGVILTGCSHKEAEQLKFQVQQTSSSFTNISSEIAEEFAFEIKEVGIHSELKLPNEVNFYYPKKFIQSIEPDDFDLIANKMANVEIEDACIDAFSSSVIVVDCKKIDGATPYIEFYLATGTYGDVTYEALGKYVLFKTQSKVYPVLILQFKIPVPSNLNLGKREIVEEYLIKQSQESKKSLKENNFDRFVKSIVLNSPVNAEPEWLLFTDEEKGFSIQYPNGLTPNTYSISENVIFSLGPDYHFSIQFYSSKDELEHWIKSSWDQYESKDINRSQEKIGENSFEKISMIFDTGYGKSRPYDYYVIKGKKGYYVMHYEKDYFEGFKDMLPTFRLLD